MSNILKPVLGSFPQLGRNTPIPMPIGLWLLNEGSGTHVNDLSGNGNHGTLSSGTIWVPGKYGHALDIEDTGRPVTLTSEITINPGTIIVWVKINNTLKEFLGKYDANNYFQYKSTTNFRVEDNDGLKLVFEDPAGFPDMVPGQRICAAATYDGTNWRVYFDSVESSTGAQAGSYMLIDTIGNGHTNATEVFDGDIEMVQIYPECFSAKQVTQLYRDPFPWFRRNPIELWSAAMIEAGGEDYERTIDDSVGILDVASRVNVINRILSEPMGVTDTDSKVSETVRTLVESLGITDVQIKDEVKIISDSLGLTDAVSRVNAFLRTVAESMNITDEVSKVWEVIRSIDDPEGITDIYEAIKGQWIIIADSLGITDEVIRLISYLRVQSDDIGIVDAITKVAVALRTIDDDMGITDEMSSQLTGLMKAAWAFMVMRQTQN